MSVHHTLIVLCVAALVCSGCGGSANTGEHLSTVSVSGVLTYQGKPLESYRVIFLPTAGNRPATGTTDAAGKFSLGTNEPGDGCPVGSYKVGVAFDPPFTGDGASDGGIEDPAKYPKPKIAIPIKFADPEKSGLTQEVPSGGLADLKLDLK